MTTKELIRDEIRKWQSNIEAKCPESTSSRNYTKEEWNAIYEYNAYTRILSFLDTLPDEPITSCNELAEAADDHIRKVADAAGHPGWDWETQDIADAFKAGAEWMKRKMMEGAVEGLICATITGTNAISFLSPLPKELTAGSEVRIIILPKEDE